MRPDGSKSWVIMVISAAMWMWKVQMNVVPLAFSSVGRATVDEIQRSWVHSHRGRRVVASCGLPISLLRLTLSRIPWFHFGTLTSTAELILWYINCDISASSTIFTCIFPKSLFPKTRHPFEKDVCFVRQHLSKKDASLLQVILHTHT